MTDQVGRAQVDDLEAMWARVPRIELGWGRLACMVIWAGMAGLMMWHWATAWHVTTGCCC